MAGGTWLAAGGAHVNGAATTAGHGRRRGDAGAAALPGGSARAPARGDAVCRRKVVGRVKRYGSQELQPIARGWLAAPLAGRFFSSGESAPQAGRLTIIRV